MMDNLYRFSGRVHLGVSGGRTSGMLLAKVLEAHGGSLPENIRVSFANTGKEHEGTFRFIQNMQDRWGVRIHWIEYRVTPSQVQNRTGLREWLEENDPDGLMVDPKGFAEVNIENASRRGEPFGALIALKRAIPNGQRPFCSAELKILPAQRLAESWGWLVGSYAEPVGLRADEKPGRLAKAKADAIRFGRQTVYPPCRRRY